VTRRAFAIPTAALLAGAVLLLARAPVARAAEIPLWLPHYDLDIHLDVCGHLAHVRQRVTWTNRHDCPAQELVFNAHSHYAIPKDKVGYLAKMAEIMRLMPREALFLDGAACNIDKVLLLERAAEAEVAAALQQTQDQEQEEPGKAKGEGDTLPAPRALPWKVAELPFSFDEKIPTALVIPLPRPVAKGETVTVEIQFTMKLPQKQGRWGQWKGVTFLTNWNPVLAYYDDHGWQPTPFVPWHQPWFNEAGVYTVHVVLPCEEKVACTGSIVSETALADGTKEVTIFCPAARDFALVTSTRFQEFEAQCGPVKAKVLAFPEHAFYANAILRIMCEALPVYSTWFGPFPYPQFTIVESYFGWNGNECCDLVMIDERVFDMPHLAENYVDYLVSHETCHQWWYNTIGTNGYCETFMDEAPAVFFSHRLLDQKLGKNNALLNYPKCLSWLPQIKRENYRYYGMYGTIGRAECGPTVQPMEKFGHVVNLFSMCYDRGSKIIGMIADQLGEAAFFDFCHIIYQKYYFRILRVADLQHELEAYTGRSWDEFFKHWLYDKGMTDWCVHSVHIEPKDGPNNVFCRCLPSWAQPCAGPCRVTVVVKQKKEYNEPTVLGICLDDSGDYTIRLPIVPQMGHMEVEDPPAHIDALADNCVQVVVDLPCKPKQIAVDPDHVLQDYNPANNFWKPRFQCRVTPCYTFLDETALTNDYDHWNFIAGPWLYFPAYEDPWFTRSDMIGVRAGAFRTEYFTGGVYAAYRTEYRDMVAGADILFDHTPFPNTQFGAIFEQRIYNGWNGDGSPSRAVLFGRYVFQYGDSLYFPPMVYAEVFGSSQDNFLPQPHEVEPGGIRYDSVTTAGIHYHMDYRTPYWDPEGGFMLDVTYGGGEVDFPGHNQSAQELNGQLSWIKSLPDGLGYLSDTRLAFRAYGAAALPLTGEFFPLGGQTLFRGFDLSDRQGSIAWVGSVEWRMPVARELNWDLCDHVIGIRHVYIAPFAEAGNAYVNGHQIGPTAYDVGAGLRVDIAWFSFIERSVISLDIAKTINDNTPFQFWLGFSHPF